MLHYRKDIDGLRAISIIIVLIFHAFPNLLRGGFVGVDIFFVISGFLITSILLTDIDQKNFSFVKFYAKRIKRLYPCLLVVLSISIGYGWFVLFPQEFQNLAKHALASTVYINNIVLYKENGYFDCASELKPFLHLWSLAIEEQFYIVWPFILMWLSKRKLPIGKIILAILVISFVYNLRALFFKNNLSSAFYIPFARFWELLAGAWLAHISIHNKIIFDYIQKQYKNLFSMLGLSLIFIAVFVLDKSKLFPGWWALLPVSGAILLILSGPYAWVNNYFLSNKMMVWIGLISYPLYLWHWPLLSFSRIISQKELDNPMVLGILCLSFVLSFLSYRFLETPARRNLNSKTSWVLLIGMLPIIVVGICAKYNVIVAKTASVPGLPKITEAMGDWEYPVKLAKLKFKDRILYKYGNGSKKILFFGDSNMEQYAVRAQKIIDTFGNNQFTAVFLTCGGYVPLPNVYRHGQSQSFWMFETAIDYVDQENVDVMVICASWIGYLSQPSIEYYYQDHNFQGSIELDSVGQQKAFKNLEKVIKIWTDKGKKVFIILNMPNLLQCGPTNMIARYFFSQPVVRVKSLKIDEWKNSSTEVHKRLRNVATNSGAVIIDPQDSLCDGDTCQVITVDGKPLYKDAAHLRPFFVRDYVNYIDQIFR
jgi:peptidoglycan/LPS O-acetylase OafA/YrhL